MPPTVVVGLLANILLLATIAVLYFLFPATWQRLIHFRDAAQQQLPAGADIVALAHAVPWGTLSLADGAPAPSATASPSASPFASPSPTAAPTASTTPSTTPSATPAVSKALTPAGTAGTYVYYRLARGTHTLVYTAAPFPTMRCQISIPAASVDTCNLLPGLASGAVHALGAARIVDAQATADHLAADTQKALFDAIQTAANPSPTQVVYGEHYLNASNQSTYNVYSPLQAALIYTVNTDPAHALPPPSSEPSATATPSAATTPATTGTPSATATTPASCVSLCDLPATPDAAASSSNTPANGSSTQATPQTTPAATGTPSAVSSAAQPWTQLANLAPVWRYTTSRGTQIAGVVSAQGGTTGATVAITWNGSWQATMDATDKAGLLGGIVSTTVSALKPPQGWTVKTYPASNPTDGYLAVVSPSSGTPAQLLYRFGILLSVNSVAYSTFPSLLHANLAERTLALGITTQ